jgi:hypothetical protein
MQLRRATQAMKAKEVLTNPHNNLKFRTQEKVGRIRLLHTLGVPLRLSD